MSELQPKMSAPRATRVRHAALLGVLSTLALLPLVWGPIGQPQDYHAFADTRPWAGLANGANILSNLPFLLIGIAGLAYLARARRADAFTHPLERVPYVVFFIGIALTSLGSAYYHRSPDNATLVWDRLPMTLTFMSLLSAMIVERVDRRAGLGLLVPLIALGVASVWYWHWSSGNGVDDLRPYLLVQFGGIVLILTIALLYRSRYTHGGAIWYVGALYLLSKVAEFLDRPIFQFTDVLSGHSLKHLLAAAAAYALLVSLRLRRPRNPG